MDYDDYDSDASDSEDDYFEFVQWLSGLTATELRQAKGDPQQQKQALCRYYKRGENANLTWGELIAFLGVSTPSILDMAGYNEAEGDVLMEISDRLTEDDVRQAVLPAANAALDL